MAKLNFETITFREKEDAVEIILLKMFASLISKEDLDNLGKWKIIDQHTIEFKDLSEKKAQTKFSFLLENSLENLTNKLTGNKVTYIHQNSGIPLIGNVSFGIVYRDSSIIEIKPITSCNLDCVYCSISEGLSSKKNDFVVEEAYLISELRKLLDLVDESVEIHIGVQGEPFLYADMELLISDLQKIPLVHTISIDTNGTLISKEMIDRLAKNDKLQINFSLDALDAGLAKKIAGTESYKVGQVQEIISYASDKINKIIVAPVLTQGYNEKELEKIILFIKALPKPPILGIQNFLRYKTGRNPAKEISWDDFYSLLSRLEQKHQIKLRLKKEDFNVRKTKELPKPFSENDVVEAVIKCPDRFDDSSIAVAQGRNISIPRCKFRKDKKINVLITRDKHNIFTGKIVNDLRGKK